MRSHSPPTVPEKIIAFCGGFWNFQILFNFEWKSTILKFCRGTRPEKLCIVIARVSMTTEKYSEPCSRKVLNISKQPWQFYLTHTRNANKDKSLVILPQWNRLRTTYLWFYLKVNKPWVKAHCHVSAQILHEASHFPVKKKILHWAVKIASKGPVSSHSSWNYKQFHGTAKILSKVGVEINFNSWSYKNMPKVITGSNKKGGWSHAKEFCKAGKPHTVCWIQEAGLRPEKQVFADSSAACNGAIAEVLWEKPHAWSCRSGLLCSKQTEIVYKYCTNQKQRRKKIEWIS